MFEGRPLIVTAKLEVSQVELTVESIAAHAVFTGCYAVVEV